MDKRGIDGKFIRHSPLSEHTLGARLKKETYLRFIARAKELGLSPTALVREILEEYMRETD